MGNQGMLKSLTVKLAPTFCFAESTRSSRSGLNNSTSVDLQQSFHQQDVSNVIFNKGFSSSENLTDIDHEGFSSSENLADIDHEGDNSAPENDDNCKTIIMYKLYRQQAYYNFIFLQNDVQAGMSSEHLTDIDDHEIEGDNDVSASENDDHCKTIA